MGLNKKVCRTLKANSVIDVYAFIYFVCAVILLGFIESKWRLKWWRWRGWKAIEIEGRGSQRIFRFFVDFECRPFTIHREINHVIRGGRVRWVEC